MLFDGIMVDLPEQKLKSESASVNFSFTPLYPPKFRAVNEFIAIRCELPEDAIANDAIALCASALSSRSSNFSAQITLTQQHLANGYVEMNLFGHGADGEYELQLNLYGKHNAIKNSNCFSVIVKNVSGDGASPLNQTLKRAKLNKQSFLFKNRLFALFSVF